MSASLRIGCRVALGLFILWQVFFLLAANLLGLAKEKRDVLAETVETIVAEIAPGWPAEKGDAQAAVQEAIDAAAPGWRTGTGDVYEAVEAVTTWTTHWSQVTGQPQGWELFSAPGYECPFPVVELRWDEPPPPPWEAGPLLAPVGFNNALSAAVVAAAARRPRPLMAYEPELLRSDNEPADPDHYLRLGQFRLRRYESYVVPILARHTDEIDEAIKERWREQIVDHLRTRQEWETVRAYLRWRMEAYQRAHPERPRPSQIILHVRRYHILTVDERAGSPWEEPDVQPIARWRPSVSPPSDYLGVEMFNPVTDTFEWLKYWDDEAGP
jgi:hypothetical protein